MARQFNGTTDKIVCSLGSCNLTAAWTVALCFRRNTNTNYHALFGTLTSGGVPAITTEIESNAAGNNVEMGQNDTTFSQSTAAFSTGAWFIVVIAKATGTAVPNFYWNNLTTASGWTDTVLGSSLGNASSQAGGTVNFSNYKSGAQDPFDGWLAVAGVWNGTALSNTQAHELSTNSRTSDWYNNSAGTPSALWEFNGTVAAGITDLTGNGANQSSISGTTQDGTNNPPSWNYNGVGSSGATVTAVPMTTTGRIVAPAVSGSGDQTVAAVPMTTTGRVVAPALSAGATVTAVPATSSGLIVAPPGLTSEMVAAPFTASGLLPAPFVSGGGNATVTAVPMTATGSMRPATIANDYTITAVPMTATGSVRAPVVSYDWTVTAPPLLATGRLPTPAVSPTPIGATRNSSLLLTGVGT